MDITQKSVVDTYGFSAGIYKDGTQSYVGLGFNAACASEYATPGRIINTDTKRGI